MFPMFPVSNNFRAKARFFSKTDSNRNEISRRNSIFATNKLNHEHQTPLTIAAYWHQHHR